MAFFDQYASRLNEAAISHLSDGLCTFRPGEDGRPDVLDVPYQFDNAFEVFDEQGLSMHVKTVLLPVDRVGDVDRKATVTINGKVWRYSSLIEDDGYFVRIGVTT